VSPILVSFLLFISANTKYRIPIPYALHMQVTTRIRARIVVVQADAVLTRGMSVDVHVHSVCEPATIERMLARVNRATGQVLERHPKVLTSTQTGDVQITFERPVCVEPFAQYKELGRVTVRYRGDTLAVGIVNDIDKLRPANANA
jgi:elongation factor 1 alpha-like protein